MCCEAEWKREVVQDHKWDFINVNEFHKTDFFTRLKYVWRYILLFKSIAVYGLDIFTAVTMISSDRWTNSIAAKGSSGVVEVKFVIAKWVFVGCIIFSFLLLGYEWYKARQVIRSRDISYSFTNLLANDYFSFKNYDNFCLFCHIDESTKKKDDLAFFVFFTFKDWKRLLLADGPRQSINGLMLYAFGQANGWQTSNIPAYWDNEPITAMLLFSMIATVLIFAGSMVLLIAAAVFYVPLLCYIQGNLKEYVCHKVDKRLSELVKKKQRQRANRAAALEKKLAKDGGLRNSKGEFVNVIMQPTLPKIRLEEDELMSKKGMGMSRSKSGDTLNMYPSNGMNNYEVYDSYNGYPPSLDYSHGQSFYGHDSTGSTSRLIDGAGPMGISYPPVIAPPPAAPSFPPPSAVRPISPGPNQAFMSPPNPPSRSNTQMTGYSSRSDRSYQQAGYSPQAYGPSNPPTAYPQSWSHGQYDRDSPSMPRPPTRTAVDPPTSLLPGVSIGGASNSTAHLTRDGNYRHQGETVISPSAYTSHSTSFPDPARYQSSSSSYGRQEPAGATGSSQRDSLGGLPYDGITDEPDTDPGPAPSYYSGSPPRNRLGNEYANEKASFRR